MHANRPITIKDIARKFKCSPSTVSRALNDHYSINEDTRKNIQEYAKKVGYQRNSVSLSLLNKKTDSLGIVVPTIGNYHESSIIDGLYSVLQPQGYILNICATNESFLLEAEYISKLLANRVECIFLSVSQETYDAGHNEHLETIIQRGVPLIFIDREYEGFTASRVTVDDYHGAYAVVEHLINMGCKRIAHLKGPNALTVSEQRFAGYLDCLRRHNLPIREELIINTNFKVDSAILPTKHLLELASPPDAIFGVNDQVAIGAMRVVKDKGLNVPHDVSVVGFDNSPISAYTYPSLTTVSRPGREIGIEASRLFLSHLTALAESPIEAIRLPSNLIIRESSLRMMKQSP
ncbi:LacI family DNA-binding transcriptional regulator [Spirosoma soli]|uniref:LacI family DNA-binding transcriptional regulator n=1 Tax=Spirosoma soli TaxID=1770529 RepID=A0ABW5M689_9BACT